MLFQNWLSQPLVKLFLFLQISWMNSSSGRTVCCIIGPCVKDVLINANSMWCSKEVPNRWEFYIKILFSMIRIWHWLACPTVRNLLLTSVLETSERLIIKLKSKRNYLLLIFLLKENLIALTGLVSCWLVSFLQVCVWKVVTLVNFHTHT